MKLVINGNDIAPILGGIATVIGAVGGLCATIFSFLTAKMTKQQNIDMAQRDQKRDKQNEEVKEAISKVPDMTSTQTLRALDIASTGNQPVLADHRED